MRNFKLFLFAIIMLIASVSFAQRDIGQIVASDPDGDPFYFTLIDQAPTDALNVTPSGMLYVSDEDALNVGVHTAYVRVKELYTPEQLEAYATMTVYVTDTTPTPGGITCDTAVFWQYTQNVTYEWQYTDSIPVAYIYTDSIQNEIITIDSLMYYILPQCCPGDTVPANPGL